MQETNPEKRAIPQEELSEFRNQEIEMIKIFYDFQFKSILEASNAVARGLPIYFTILGAICAYFMTQKIDPNIVKYIVIIVMSVSVGGLIVYTFFVRGILVGLDELKETFKLGGEQIFIKSTIEKFIKRGKRAIKSFLVVIYGIIIVICIGFIRYLLYFNHG